MGAEPVYCMGYYAVGGNFTSSADRKTITVVPDDQPGKSYTFYNNPAWAPENQTTIAELIATFGTSGRTIFSGSLLSDGRIISNGGGGKLSPNEFAATQGPNPAGCSPSVTGMFPPAPAPGPGTPAPPPPPPPAPPWEGTQGATVQVTGGGIPENVKVYGADGVTYRLASSSDPTNATELATTAPQGTPLTIRGRWDPATGLVAVSTWWITQLGEGEKKYGITPEGQLGPQSPDYPSTDWPGGLPKTPAAGAPGPGAPAAGLAGTEGTVALVFALGLLGAMLLAVASRGRRGER